MKFDPNNKIVKLCSKGMLLEGEGKPKAAKALFETAWDESVNDFEKFTAAHYLARHQNSVPEKLKWDLIALNLALGLKDDGIKGTYPSLYLNVAKCYEELGDDQQAIENYLLAQSYIQYLLDDGYGNMIKGGIENGLKRMG